MAELTATRTADGSWVFDTAAIVAAAENIPAAPPAAWFEPREFDGPTPLTFTEDGQVYGHIADRSVPHIGLPGKVGAPRSKSGYKWYATGQVRCDDGSLVSTGRITMDTSHADLKADASNAQAHYDQSGAAVADVVAYDDEWGVAVCGAARPGLTAEQMRMAMASPPSGDWRSVGGPDLELVACLLVSVPGFPVPRANLAASGAPTALVAAGVVMRGDPTSSTKENDPMTEQSHPEPTTPESLVAASPFGKDAPAPEPDDSDTAPGFESGDSVQIEGTDMIAQVAGTSEDGGVVVELVLPADMLSAADEDDAMAASARFSDRMADRRRDSDIAKLTEAVTSLAASAQAAQESASTQSAKLDEVLAKQRADEAERLIASAGLEA